MHSPSIEAPPLGFCPCCGVQSLEDALEHLELEEADDDDASGDEEECVSPGGTARRGLWGVLNFDGDA